MSSQLLCTNGGTMTRFGTNNFVSLDRAIRYYQATEGSTRHEAELLVQIKLAERAIEIGRPAERPNETLEVNEDGRWEYVKTKSLPRTFPLTQELRLEKSDAITLVQFLNSELGDSRIKGTGETMETLNRVYHQLTGHEHPAMPMRRKYTQTKFGKKS